MSKPSVLLAVLAFCHSCHLVLSFYSPPPPAPYSLKPGETKCATEDATCSCNGQVKYGALNKFSAYRSASGSIACSNSVFGDPLPGVRKQCVCKATKATSTVCAVGQTVQVRDNGKSWKTGTVTSLGPIKVKPRGWSGSYTWDQLKGCGSGSSSSGSSSSGSSSSGSAGKICPPETGRTCKSVCTCVAPLPYKVRGTSGNAPCYTCAKGPPQCPDTDTGNVKEDCVCPAGKEKLGKVGGYVCRTVSSGWSKLYGKHCTGHYVGGSYYSLSSAKSACAAMSSCTGVYDNYCDGYNARRSGDSYRLCNQNYYGESQHGSCIYQRPGNHGVAPTQN